MGIVSRRRQASSSRHTTASHRILPVLEWVFALGLLVFVALAASQVVFAASSDNHPDSRADHGMQQESLAPDHAAPQLSPYEAADRARDKFGGRVLNVVLEHGSSGPYYRVKLLDRGRVRVVRVKAGQ